MNKVDYTIIDNFLEKNEFETLQNFMTDSISFPWYYTPFVDYYPGHDKKMSLTDNLNNYQFTHGFYIGWEQTSNYLQILNPILKKLNPISWLRIKANLTTRTEKRFDFQYHVDMDVKNEHAKTAIFYVNSNNGVTILEDGTEISSIENRMIIFDQKTLHKGTTCTDKKFRCIINFNYIN